MMPIRRSNTLYSYEVLNKPLPPLPVIHADGSSGQHYHHHSYGILTRFSTYGGFNDRFKGMQTIYEQEDMYSITNPKHKPNINDIDAMSYANGISNIDIESNNTKNMTGMSEISDSTTISTTELIHKRKSKRGNRLKKLISWLFK